jgi:hypothetical protein
MKILSITEKIPHPATLPDGIYTGTWGGYIIELRHQRKYYELTSEVGVKGMGFGVVITIKDGIATFEQLKN